MNFFQRKAIDFIYFQQIFCLRVCRAIYVWRGFGCSGVVAGVLGVVIGRGLRLADSSTLFSRDALRTNQSP